MRFPRSLVLALASATTVIGAAAAPAHAAAAPAPPSPAAQATVLIDCAHRPQVRPGDFVLTCADANDQLTGMHWSQWGANSAVGTGYQRVNDCTPSCVAGKVHTYRVQVRLHNSRPWPGHGQVRHFTSLTLSYPSAQPSWKHSTSYDLWH